MDQEINEIDTYLRFFPLEISFSPAMWEIITDVEILKKFGVYHVDKMQLIQLMVAKF